MPATNSHQRFRGMRDWFKVEALPLVIPVMGAVGFAAFCAVRTLIYNPDLSVDKFKGLSNTRAREDAPFRFIQQEAVRSKVYPFNMNNTTTATQTTPSQNQNQH